MKKKVDLYQGGNLNYDIICRRKTRYFNVKLSFLNRNLYISLRLLNLRKKLNNFHKNYFFIRHQINKILNQLDLKKKSYYNCF